MAESSTVAAPVGGGQGPNSYPRLSEGDERMRVYKLLASGGLAGTVSRTITAPIDRLKMLLQITDSARGMSLKEGFQKMRSEGSVCAFFKGNGTNILKIAPETAMKLTMNDRFKEMVAKDPYRIQPSERLVAGGMAGSVAHFLLYPLDTIRVRLAVCPHGTYRSIRHAAQCMWILEGPRSLYAGLMPSMMGILPFAAVDIALFETAREWMEEEYDGDPPSFAILMAGMLSSSVAQLVSYPLALMRTRLQAQMHAQECTQRYTSMSDVLWKTVAREGWFGTYKGLLPNLIKIAPASGISWYVFEKTKDILVID